MKYMLDTNMVSYLARGNVPALTRFAAIDPAAICISAITHAELLYGIAKNPAAVRSAAILREFIDAVQIEPWDCARAYAEVRAEHERRGINLAPLDLMIAAHAHSLGAVLVTADRAFKQIQGLQCENWAE